MDHHTSRGFPITALLLIFVLSGFILISLNDYLGDQFLSQSVSLKQPITSPAHMAIIPNAFSRSLTVIDTLRNRKVQDIPLTEQPWLVAMSGVPNDQYAYASTLPGGASRPSVIYKIDLNTFSIVKTLSLVPSSSYSYVGELEISPDNKYLVAVDSSDMSPIFIFDTATDQLLHTIVLCSTCSSSFNRVVFSEPGQYEDPYAFFMSVRNGSVYAINLVSGAVSDTSFSFPPDSVVYDFKASKGFLYISFCRGARCVLRQYDIGWRSSRDFVSTSAISDLEVIRDGEFIAFGQFGMPGSLVLLDPITFEVTRASSFGNEARNLVYHQDSDQIWLQCSSYCMQVFDVSTRRFLISIPLLYSPTRHVSFSRDGKYFYAAGFNRSGNRFISIDTQTYQPSYVFPIASNPRGVFVRGDNRVKE